MPSKSSSAAVSVRRELHLESFEPRVVMCATPAPDFYVEFFDDSADHLAQPDATATPEHALTGLEDVYADYGFTGAGQTVAVIDSGIAYTHSALGGGLGANYRVVGGYDFTEENDTDFYDDGPFGAHGTHVAGIIGSDDATYRGVAPGVDLVGLRVFNDAGEGYFHWVEDALRWVHDHRNDFENPITAVNLSIGTQWNEDSIPAWATLEDEFAQLEADGIFISVAAGNSFTSYNESGLSYPGASPYVVPVSSVDDDGSLSYFSQRNDRVIAAPGRGVVSTVPDYLGNRDGQDNDFVSFSGTSMAAPYVAGASVLLRQAYEFVGDSTVDQDTIYDLMRQTADLVYDSETGAYYHRLNIDAAIRAIMPADDFGSSMQLAHAVGTLADGDALSGHLTTLDDADYFTFQAAATGRVTLSVTSTHDADARWTYTGGGTLVGENLVIDVTAGNQYTFALGSAAGIGYYDVAVSVEASPADENVVDWGTVELNAISIVQLDANTAYAVTATRDGWLSISAEASAAETVSLEIFDEEGHSLARSNHTAGSSRLDAYVAAGETYLLRASGTAGTADFRLANLASQSGTTFTVHGTEGDDEFSFDAEAKTLSIAGFDYAWSAATAVEYHAHGGDDFASLVGTHRADSGEFGRGRGTLTGTDYQVNLHGVERFYVHGRSGADSVRLIDSAADDTFFANSTWAELVGGGYSSRVVDFEQVVALSSSGLDQATLYDSVGADTFTAHANSAELAGSGFANRAVGFDYVRAYATANHDTAVLWDSAGDDLFTANSRYARLTGANFENYAHGFDAVYAYAGGGNDRAILDDSAGDDRLVARPNYVQMTGAGFLNYAKNFESVYAYAGAGNDEAVFYDSTGDDRFFANPTYAHFSGDGFYNYAKNFDAVRAYAGAGHDQAVFHDSIGNDVFTAKPHYAQLAGNGFFNYAKGFASVHAFAGGGHDQAVLYDSVSNDKLVARHDAVELSGENFSNTAHGFDATGAFAGGGFDRAFLYGSDGDDRFVATPFDASLTGSGFANYSRNFDEVYGSAGAGNDVARLVGSDADDYLIVDAKTTELRSADYAHVARNFDLVHTDSGAGHDQAIVNDSAVDDLLTATADDLRFLSDDAEIRFQGLDLLWAYSNRGGDDVADLDALNIVNYLVGEWLASSE